MRSEAEWAGLLLGRKPVRSVRRWKSKTQCHTRGSGRRITLQNNERWLVGGLRSHRRREGLLLVGRLQQSGARHTKACARKPDLEYDRCQSWWFPRMGRSRLRKHDEWRPLLLRYR